MHRNVKNRLFRVIIRYAKPEIRTDSGNQVRPLTKPVLNATEG
jgi:hypothetical protein